MRPHHNRVMRFQRGIRYPHPPRGPARKPYTMSEAALRQRRRNLKRTRIRSDRETAIIKRLIWQACFDGGERLSQRARTLFQSLQAVVFCMRVSLTLWRRADDTVIVPIDHVA